MLIRFTNAPCASAAAAGRGLDSCLRRGGTGVAGETNRDRSDRRWLNHAVAILQADAARSRETPLVRLPGLPVDGIDLYLKDESAHATGSLKHRLARELLLNAICEGRIGDGTPLVEASSGSTAISEAYFARQLGIPFYAVMPRTTSPGKIALIEQHGGLCHLVDDPVAIYEQARQLAEQVGGYYIDQFTNAAHAANWRGEDNLAAEVARQMADRRHPVPAWIVVGAGTGGTTSLFARHARRHARDSRLCVVDPENSAFYPAWTARNRSTAGGASRIEGIGRPRVEPSFPEFNVVDHMIKVPDAASIATTRELERWTGRRFGASTGTTVWGALQLLADMHAAGLHGAILALAGDAGDRYTDTYYNNKWVNAQRFDPRPYQRTLQHFKATGEWLDTGN